MGRMTILSIIVGVIGTGLGSLIGLCFKNKGNKPNSCVLSFAGGVMIAIVFLELIPSAINAIQQSTYRYLIVTIGVVLGIATIMLLDYCVLVSKQSMQKKHIFGNNNKTQKTHKYTTIDKNSKKANMTTSGIILMLAIALHNFPEGLALGSSGAVSTKNAIVLTILLALHNIPEGMAISVPLISGGVSKTKAVFAGVLSGSVTILGALIGFKIGFISPTLIAVCLSLASGAMLFVTYRQIIPQALILFDTLDTTLWLLFGILIGMLAIFCL